MHLLIRIKLLLLILIVEFVYGNVDISEKKYLLDECKSGNAKSCYKFSKYYDTCMYNGACSQEYLKVIFKPYKKACEGGIVSACSRLGDMYIFGYGTKRDIPKGIHIMEQACKKNDAWACGYMGMVYKWGWLYYKRDYKKAYEYYSKACQLSNDYNDCKEMNEIKNKLQKLDF